MSSIDDLLSEIDGKDEKCVASSSSLRRGGAGAGASKPAQARDADEDVIDALLESLGGDSKGAETTSRSHAGNALGRAAPAFHGAYMSAVGAPSQQKCITLYIGPCLPGFEAGVTRSAIATTRR